MPDYDDLKGVSIKDALTYEDIAKYLRIKVQTVRRYHYVGELPPKDGEFGSTPYWTTKTIKKWLIARGPRTNLSQRSEQ